MLPATRAAQSLMVGGMMESTEVEHDSVEACVAACGQCSQICLTHVRHCLEIGDEHAAAAHIAMLLTCAHVCRTASDLMSIDSDWYPTVCDLCAQVCEECAEACAAMDDMQDCAAACRHCAHTCRTMVAEIATEEPSDTASERSTETMN
jgi:hypothetical protein